MQLEVEMMSAANNFAMNSLWVPSLVFGCIPCSQGNLNAFFGLVRLSFYNRPQNVGRGLQVWDMPSCSEDVLEIGGFAKRQLSVDSFDDLSLLVGF